jgi:hypothetical protein
MHKPKTTPICEKSQLGVVFSVFVIQIGFILKNHVLCRKKVKKLTDKLQKFLFAIYKK